MSRFDELLETSKERDRALSQMRDSLISLEEARQRLGLLPPEKDKPMEIGPLSPPEPPADPPGYTLLGGSRTAWTKPTGETGFTGSLSYSHLRLSERPLGRPMPTDLSFGPGYYLERDEPLPWWVYWQFLWIGVSAVLAIGMIFHVLP